MFNKITVRQIINEYFLSNCFIIEDITENCIIIDPGSSKFFKLLRYLKSKNKKPYVVILTHEHFDHTAGVDSLATHFDFDLICSPACNKGIRDSKVNMSFYFDEITPLGINKTAVEVTYGKMMNIAGITCHFYHTPGHSPGSMTIKIDDCLFTGDTPLNNTKVPLTLPSSNKFKYENSLRKLTMILEDGDKVYPGHGDPFIYNKTSFPETMLI